MSRALFFTLVLAAFAAHAHLGDSITDGWRKEKTGAKKIFDDNFGAFKPANFGIGGDCTQHVLWRIQNGEVTTTGQMSTEDVQAVQAKLPR